MPSTTTLCWNNQMETAEEEVVKFKLGGKKQTKDLLEASFANKIEEEEKHGQISFHREASQEEDIMQVWKQKQETELSRIEKAVQIAGFQYPKLSKD